MKIPLPKDKYIKGIEVNEDGLDITFEKRKKIALTFISINERYWPYLLQVIDDCKKLFLPQHKVDFHIWSDMPEDRLLGASIYPTEPIEWPAPTLMRYHLFLQQEEKLKDYDYIFYLDADMRVLTKISDEVLGTGLTAAEHPMYSLRKEYIPPYEPNPDSTAYIPRPGKVVDENGKPRFKPYYYAGGFQGGVASEWIAAMKVMRDKIDIDFNNNYTAIWNDESHWNRYLFDYQGDSIVLSPSYIYPDSLIKEYYEPLWGRSYEPKIMTVTKPFSLSKAGGEHLNQFLGNAQPTVFTCPLCRDNFDVTGHTVNKVVSCPGSGKPHQLDMTKK